MTAFMITVIQIFRSSNPVQPESQVVKSSNPAQPVSDFTSSDSGVCLVRSDLREQLLSASFTSADFLNGTMFFTPIGVGDLAYFIY